MNPDPKGAPREVHFSFNNKLVTSENDKENEYNISHASELIPVMAQVDSKEPVINHIKKFQIEDEKKYKEGIVCPGKCLIYR